MHKTWALAGAINAFLSVAAGAFGAHALKSRLSERMLNAFETGARYQMFHALGLLAVAVLAAQPAQGASAAGYSMLAGITLFSGSLYVMALTDTPRLGIITPFGGLFLLASWVLFARAAMSLP